MPNEYSATFTTLSRCDIGDNLPNQCAVSLPQSPVPIPGYNLVKVDGVDHQTTIRKAYLNSGYIALIDTYPHLPDLKFVTQSFPDGKTRMYQFDRDGMLSQCHDFENAPLRMSFPDDYLLYPLGPVGDNLYRYRVSFIGPKGHTSDGDQWIHIDYFEDVNTFEPKSLISDESIIQVDSMLTGSGMEYFSSTGLEISDDEFAKCSIATQVVQSDRFKTYSEGGSFRTENSTIFEKKQYLQEETAWDWVNRPYPPPPGPLSSFSPAHVRYFSSHTSYNESNDQYTGVDKFGEWLSEILNLEPEDVVINPPEVIEPHPDGIYYVPYQNVFDRNWTNQSFDLSTVTWTNATAEERSPNTRSLQDSSIQRRLGVSFNLNPLIPVIEIDIQMFAASYEPTYDQGVWYHNIGLEGQGCFLGCVCVSGDIHATIPQNGASKSNYGGSITFSLDLKGVEFRLLTLRYDYYAGTVDYEGYYLSKGTHIAAVENTVSLSLVRGTGGVEVTQSKKKVKKSDTTVVRYNAGKANLFVKAEYYSLDPFDSGWTTYKSYTYTVSSWGATDPAAIANCDGSRYVEIPLNQFLPAGWSVKVGDITASVTDTGVFQIKLIIDSTMETVWTFGSPCPSGTPCGVSANFDESTFGFYQGPVDGLIPGLLLNTGQIELCRYAVYSGTRTLCSTEGGSTSFYSGLSQTLRMQPGYARLRLYGNGNLRFDGTQLVKVFGGLSYNFLQSWFTAWESGVRGSCAKKL